MSPRRVFRGRAACVFASTLARMSGTWQPPPQPQPFGYGPQGYPPFGYAPHPVPPPVPARGGMPTWLKVLLILFVIGAVLGATHHLEE